MNDLKKMMETYEPGRKMWGDIRIFLFDPVTKRIKRLIRRRNLILYSGADVLALMASGAPGFHVATMYMEYENLADPGDTPSIPSYDRTGGIAYYNGLSASPNKDFLRIPITVSPSLSSSDDAIYDGNVVTFFAVSEGLAGFHGKPFGPSSNSAVYGAGLVASPDPSDQTQDRVFARTYTGIGKILKETGFEIGITWQLRFN